MGEVNPDDVEELRRRLRPLDPTSIPEGWKKERAGRYLKKKFCMVMTGSDEVTISISVKRHGYPCHPTDDQCQRALQAFGFDQVQEVPRTSTARYFKHQRKGLT